MHHSSARCIWVLLLAPLPSCVGASTEGSLDVEADTSACVEILAPWDPAADAEIVWDGLPLPDIFFAGEVHCSEPAVWATSPYGSGDPANWSLDGVARWRVQPGDTVHYDGDSNYSGGMYALPFVIEMVGLHRVITTVEAFYVIDPEGQATSASYYEGHRWQQRRSPNSSEQDGFPVPTTLPDHYRRSCPGLPFVPEDAPGAIPIAGSSGLVEVHVEDETGRFADLSIPIEFDLPEECE